MKAKQARATKGKRPTGHEGKKRCGAKTRSGKPCKAWPMPNGRCRLHGGLTPRGPAHGAFKHGRYSSHVPSRLAARYDQARTDPELLQLRDDIALVDARIGDLLDNVDQAVAGPDAWQHLQKTLEATIAAGKARNAQRVATLLGELQDQVDAGATEAEQWGQIVELIERRRRLVETERKTLIDLQQMITAERALAMIGVLESILREHIPDREILAAIGADIERQFVAGPGGQPAG